MSLFSRAAKRGGGFKRGGFPIWIWTCPSFFVLLFVLLLNGGFQTGGLPDLDSSFLFCPFSSFRNEKSAQRPKFSAGRPCGHPAKNFGQPLQILEKRAFRHGHAARTSTKKLGSEKLRADFSFPSFFWDFPDFFSGIFPNCSGMVRGFSRFVLFLFLGLLRAPTRNRPERVRDTIWTCPKKSGKPPGLEPPPV